MRSRERRSGTQRWRCVTVPRLSIAAAVRPTDTASAVTMPGQYRDSSLMRTSIRPGSKPEDPGSVTGRGRVAATSSGESLGEAVARHGVDSEGGEQLAQRVVGREVSVLELADERHHFLQRELAEGVAQHLLFVGPVEHAFSSRACR